MTEIAKNKKIKKNKNIMDKNNNFLMNNIVLETTKDIDNMSKRINSLSEEDNKLSERFSKTDELWINQKKDMNKIMDSLKYDMDIIRKDIKDIVSNTEKLIIEFRNKAKQDKVDMIKSRIESNKYENYITKKRLIEIIRKEINNKN